MKLFSKASALIQEKMYSLFPGLVKHPLQLGCAPELLGIGVGKRERSAAIPASGSPLPTLRRASRPQDPLAAPPTAPDTVKGGPLKAICSQYLAAVATNDTLRGQLAALGRKKPGAGERLAFVTGGKLPAGVTVKTAIARLQAVRRENDAFAKELPASPVAAGAPAPTAPKLTENERIFAAWEQMTGETKSLYYRAHQDVLRGPSPSALAALTQDELAGEVLLQLKSEGLLPEQSAPAAGVSTSSYDAIWQQFGALTGAAKATYYRDNKAVLGRPRLGATAAAKTIPTTTIANGSPTSPDDAIWRRFDELKGGARTAFYRAHKAMLSRPRPGPALRASLPVPSSSSPARQDAVWKDPAPDLFARFESLTGSAKAEFFREHKAVLSRPQDFFAVKA